MCGVDIPVQSHMWWFCYNRFFHFSQTASYIVVIWHLQVGSSCTDHPKDDSIKCTIITKVVLTIRHEMPTEHMMSVSIREPVLLLRDGP